MRFLVPSCALVALFSLGLWTSIAPAREKSPAESLAAVPLFTAIEAEQVEAKVIPRDSTHATIQLKNLSKEPLVVSIPPHLLAAPVLAQFQFPGGNNNGNVFGNPQNQGANQAPQQLGLGIGNGANNFQGQNNNNNFQNGGLFRIPEGKVVRIRIEAVCLDHGNPDPSPHHKYELRPIAERSDDEILLAALMSLGDKSISQRVAQAVAWHQVNDKTWDELSKMSRPILGGPAKRLFTTAEIEAARLFVQQFDKATLAGKVSASTQQ